MRSFTSLAAARAARGAVRDLDISGAEVGEAVAEFPLLESLRLSNADIRALPQAVLGLRRLKRLALYALDIESLPAGIDALDQLESLFVGSCQELTTLPDAIGRLTALKELAAPANALETIPESIARLPNLQRLDLSSNRLRSLPDGLGAMPALQTLNIRYNAFTSLPPSVGLAPQLQLEPRFRALYRSLDYRPELTAELSPEQLLVQGDPVLSARLRDTLSKGRLGRYADPFVRLSRRAVRFTTTTGGGPAALGATRFGGAPDLPPGLAHPMTDGAYWIFHAQIDLAEIAGLQTFLPRDGRLLFFTEDHEALRAVQVLHDRTPANELVRHVYPKNAVFFDGNTSEAFEGCLAEARIAPALPNLYNRGDKFVGDDAVLAEIDDRDADFDALSELEDQLTGRGAGCWPHWINSFVFTQHESPEEQAAEQTDTRPEDWVVLLSLSSDPNPGFQFWDSGTFTYAIHQKDLAAGDFTRVRPSIET